MNFTDFFIHRAVTTTLLMAAILIFGIFSYSTLPVSDLPQVEYPTIQVSASLPGANPDTMASTVATPLERQFTTIAGSTVCRPPVLSDAQPSRCNLRSSEILMPRRRTYRPPSRRRRARYRLTCLRRRLTAK